MSEVILRYFDRWEEAIFSCQSQSWMSDASMVERDDPPCLDTREPMTMYDASRWFHNGTVGYLDLVSDRTFLFQGIVLDLICQWLCRSMPISCRYFIIFKWWDEE